MPVRVEMRSGKHCVVKTETGEVEKCYDNHDDAMAYAAALNMAHARAKGYIHGERPLSEDVKSELNKMSDDF